MITLREAAAGLLTVVESAIEAGDWKVDGACDPNVEIIRLKNALAKPNKDWVGLTDDDIDDLWKRDYFHLHYEFPKTIELILKEKNT